MQRRNKVAPKCHSARSNVKTQNPSHGTYRLFDEKGLYLEVTPKAQKWWRLKYRYNGKEKRISLGVFPEVG